LRYLKTSYAHGAILTVSVIVTIFMLPPTVGGVDMLFLPRCMECMHENLATPDPPLAMRRFSIYYHP